MTLKERIVAALRGDQLDHTQFSPFLAYVWEHLPREIQDAGQLAFHHSIGADLADHPELEAEFMRDALPVSETDLWTDDQPLTIQPI